MSNVTKFIDNRQFFKANYADALKYVIPSLYFEDDYNLNNKDIDILDKIINSNLVLINNFSNVIPIVGASGTSFSSVNTPSAISQFFVKQNDLTDISISDFERIILIPIGKSFKDFNSSAEFSTYLKETLLPGIRLNLPTLDFLEGGTVTQNHAYLINNLSWFYFLNLQPNLSLSYQPSSYVHDILVTKTYVGQTLSLNDGIRGVTTHIWNNASGQTWSALPLIPSEFKASSTVYTSGTQQLDKLLTLIDVIYSPLYIDDGDYKVKNAIDDYLQNSFLLTEKQFQGPFLKLLRAFSFSFTDYSNQIDRIESLNDLDECPDEYLPLLAELIGWKLFGSEPDRWRLQIANAVDIYKTVGTKKCLQLVADSMFSKDIFNVSSTIKELWESYIPFLVQYSLATESVFLKSFNTWTAARSQELQVAYYNSSSMDENIKICVDKIVRDTVYRFPNNFILGKEKFNLDSSAFVFNYRNTVNTVPPFEEIPYYTKVVVTREMIDFIRDKLICFGVPLTFANQFAEYVKSKLLDSTGDYALKNSWLFFTSSMEFAPNWDSVIKDISNYRSEYLPLWNGKSSFFQITLDSSSFNFGKTSLAADSSEILLLMSRAIKDFSPAKAVPDIIARSSAEDLYPYAEDEKAPLIRIPEADYSQIKYSSGAAITGYMASAYAMQSYKRGYSVTSVATFQRGSVDSIIDSLVSPTATTANLPRRNHRRRDLKQILPKEGYYDRSGFNMPTHSQIFNANVSSFLALGLIPSSMQYVSVPDHNNIPPIYQKCEDLTSSNTYSGLTVSNTFPVRGWKI